MFNGFASSRYPNRGQDAATFETGPGTDAPDDPPTIDAMPLQIHTQPDPDQLCETCGGPSELVSQTITPWDGNETMAREVSPWTPLCGPVVPEPQTTAFEDERHARLRALGRQSYR